EVEPRGREEDMTDQGFGRRDFLKTTIAGGAAAAATTTAIPASSTQAQQPAAQPAAEGYEFLNLDQAAFVKRWSLARCRPPSARLKAPRSESTSTSTGRSAAPGARASGSICRGRGK